MAMDEAKTRWTYSFKWWRDESKDEIHDGRKSIVLWTSMLNFGMSFYSREECRKDKNLYGKSPGGEDGKEDNMATPEVHQRGGDVNPFFST